MNSVVMTGVSSGIGYAAAQALLARGWRVFGSVRKEADAQRVQAELGASFTPLLFDVTDHAAIATAVDQVKTTLNGQPLTGLVNNAGISVIGPLAEMSLADFRWQFEVNLFGLLDVTQQVLPLLKGGHGRVVNIGSVSGTIAYPFMGAYAASKHALEGLSDALRRELVLYGIDVILVSPGTTQTAIIEKTGRQTAGYEDTDYAHALENMAAKAAERSESALPVAVVVDAIVDALESRRPKTRYTLPRKRMTGWWVPRWLPDRWLDRFAASQLGIVPNGRGVESDAED